MTRAVVVREDPLISASAIAVLERHLALMRATSPEGHVHALDLDGLRAPSITFWAAWEGNRAIGCAALKAIGDREGELKSMHVLTERRRAGTGARLLERVLEEARARGYRRVCLETGAQAAFDGARRFYRRHGFVDTAPFGGYVADGWSAFLARELGR